MNTPEASRRPTGTAEPPELKGLDPVTASVIRVMQRAGIPITRENYIAYNWPEIPNPWPAELEAELPPFLQDWSQFGGRR